MLPAQVGGVMIILRWGRRHKFFAYLVFVFLTVCVLIVSDSVFVSLPYYLTLGFIPYIFIVWTLEGLYRLINKHRAKKNKQVATNEQDDKILL